MRKKSQIIIITLILLLVLTACEEKDLGIDMEEDAPIEVDKALPKVNTLEIVDPSGNTISTRINPPEGFERVSIEVGSFHEYLRELPLKPHGSPVLYYNGKEKRNANIYMAVVDMDIGDRDLQQCADAIIRLRGEYFYGRGEYDKIHFNFTNGFRVDYSKWMEGYRIIVQGNNTHWEKRTEPSNTYEDFRRYMNIVFAYAGTLSLEQELVFVERDDMKIGDIFIQGGSPGHAIIVVDMAENKETGEKLFLLAQSYMPAQDTQILINPNDKSISPWYSLDFGEKLYTPEWNFTKNNLKRFVD